MENDPKMGYSPASRFIATRVNQIGSHDQNPPGSPAYWWGTNWEGGHGPTKYMLLDKIKQLSLSGLSLMDINIWKTPLCFFLFRGDLGSCSWM
jgi:hypothetical protein